MFVNLLIIVVVIFTSAKVSGHFAEEKLLAYLLCSIIK